MTLNFYTSIHDDVPAAECDEAMSVPQIGSNVYIYPNEREPIMGRVIQVHHIFNGRYGGGAMDFTQAVDVFLEPFPQE